MIAIKNATHSPEDSACLDSQRASSSKNSRNCTDREYSCSDSYPVIRENSIHRDSKSDIACESSRRKYIHCGRLKGLSDKTLLERLRKLRGAERTVLVKILKYLNEIERRRLYVPRGYATLYEFCTDYLKYSRSAAMRRIHAARCIDKFSQMAGLLRSGELTLTVVAMISGIMNRNNSHEIINAARGKSTRDVEILVSRHKPGFMLRDRVKPICLMEPDVNKNDSSRIPGAGKN